MKFIIEIDGIFPRYKYNVWSVNEVEDEHGMHRFEKDTRIFESDILGDFLDFIEDIEGR